MIHSTIENIIKCKGAHYLKMNYLFVVNRYYPDSTSGANVIKKIAEKFAEKNKVCVYTLTNDVGYRKIDEYNGVKIFRGDKRRLQTLSRLSWKVRSMLTGFCGINIGFFSNNIRDIENILEYEKIERAFAVCFPIYSLYCLSVIKKEILWSAIYLDPYYSNEQMSHKTRRFRLFEERRLLKNSDSVYINSPLKNDYTRCVIGKECELFELPNLEKKNDQNGLLLPNADCYYNFVYTGTLYHDIRTPEYVLNLWKRLCKDRISGKALRLCLIGNNDGKFEKNYFEQWQRQLGNNLLMMSRVSEKEASQICSSADVLINIGNTVTNQMPGKVIDYLSYGKPIISFFENEKDPSIGVLNKYPLHLGFIDKNYEHDVSCFRLFLKENIGNEISFYEIESLFPEYTVDSVCRVLERKG